MNTFSRSGILALTFCALSTVPRITSAQGDTAIASAGAGRIIGKVLDSRTGSGLTDVAIQVVGTTAGTSSGVEGRYVLGPRGPSLCRWLCQLPGWRQARASRAATCSAAFQQA